MIDHNRASVTRTAAGHPGRSLVTILLVGLLLALVGLDGTPLRGLYDDVDRALIARNMAQSGDWLVASYLDRPLLTKPPLMYWSAGFWYRLTGRSDELPARLPSVLGMLVLALGTWHLGRRLADDRTGLFAALLLLTMHLFLAMARQPLIDTVMLAGFGVCLAALGELVTAEAGRRTRWWLLLTVGFAWSVMTKGPVLLPLLLLLLLPLARGPVALRPTGRQALAMLGLFLLLVVPWHVVMLLVVPEAQAVWRTELLGRFTGSSEFHAWTQKPWWFYLPDLANTLPWLPLWLGGLVWAWQRRREDRLSRLLLWWALGGLAYFTLASATKRSYYLLPLYPAFALLAAAFWQGWQRHTPGDGFPRRLLRGAWIATCVVVAGLLAAVVAALARGWLDWWWALGALVVVASGGAVLARRQLGGPCGLPGLILAAGTVLLVYHAAIVPPLHAYLGGKPFYAEVRPLLDEQPHERLLLCRVHLTLTAFYLERQQFHEAQPATLAEHAARGGGGWLITRPDLAAGVPGLVPVLERTLHSPFGPETRALGLYRLPD